MRGNYWHDYKAKGGYDGDMNGVGEVVYNILGLANANDTVPLWDWVLPNITVNYPSSGSTLGETTPSYNIEVVEFFLDTLSYSFNGGVSTTFSQNGTFSSTLWKSLAEGTVIILFTANDTFGNLGAITVTITLDLSDNNPDGFGIPGYDIFLMVGIIGLIVVFRLFSYRKRD